MNNYGKWTSDLTWAVFSLPVAKPPVKKAEKSKMQQKAEAHAAKQKAAAAAKKAQPAQEE